MATMIKSTPIFLIPDQGMTSSRRPQNLPRVGMIIECTLPRSQSMTRSVSLITPTRAPSSMSIISLPAKSL